MLHRFAFRSVCAAIVLTIFASAAAAQPQIGWITLDGPLPEAPSPFAWLSGEPSNGVFNALLEEIDAAASREGIVALAVNVKSLQADTAQIDALRAAFGRVRAAGRPVHIFAENYGPAELLLAAGADEVIIQPGGMISFPGLHMEEMFLADTLAMIGLEADFVQVGDYKGASEQFARSSPSPEWSQNLNLLLDDLWGHMRTTMREGYGYSEAELDAVLAEAWAADAEEAIELGLVDAAIDALDVQEHLRTRYDASATFATDLRPKGDGLNLEQMSNPFAIFGMLSKTPTHAPTRPTIALLHINGPIVDGESQPASLMGGSSVGSRTVRKALKQIEDEDLVRGLVVRINSPGGSAIASEMIWQGIRRVAETKPVFVSVGGMAASGGYYIAVAGDRIYLDRSSIVGSIGVVGGKFVMGGLYEKLNVGVVSHSRGPRAELMSTLTPWTQEQRGLIRSMMTETYDLFVSRVRQGRGERVEIDEIAEGRLFVGRRAVENGMADGLGDLEYVIDALASERGLPGGGYDVMTWPAPKSFEEMMEEMFKPFVSAPQASLAEAGGTLLRASAVAALRELAGPAAWPSLRDSLEAALLLRNEQVLLVSPQVLLFR